MPTSPTASRLIVVVSTTGKTNGVTLWLERRLNGDAFSDVLLHDGVDEETVWFNGSEPPPSCYLFPDLTPYIRLVRLDKALNHSSSISRPRHTTRDIQLLSRRRSARDQQPSEFGVVL